MAGVFGCGTLIPEIVGVVVSAAIAAVVVSKSFWGQSNKWPRFCSPLLMPFQTYLVSWLFQRSFSLSHKKGAKLAANDVREKWMMNTQFVEITFFPFSCLLAKRLSSLQMNYVSCWRLTVFWFFGVMLRVKNASSRMKVIWRVSLNNANVVPMFSYLVSNYVSRIFWMTLIFT